MARLGRRDLGRPLHSVVVGGGLAGIAAASRLADGGRQVTLLESRPRLGGATASFVRHGLTVDTGQHVALRCYDRYRTLLDRIGVGHHLRVQDRLDIPVLLPGQRPTRLRRTRGLPAPAHLLGAVATYRGLSVAERLAAARAVHPLQELELEDPALDERTFADWLGEHGQSAQAVHRLWGMIIIAALNTVPERASLALAAFVVRTALLSHRTAGDLAIPTVPLSELHGGAALRDLPRRGIRVFTNQRVRQIDTCWSPVVPTAPKGAAFVIRTATDEIDADEVIVAVPHTVAAGLLPPGTSAGMAAWLQLGSAPIVNVHLVLDRRVTDLRFAALPDSAAQWVFDKTAVSGLDEGQYLVTSISAATAAAQVRAGVLVERQLVALRSVLPGLAAARVVDSFVTREPEATFDQRAGTARLRPRASTRLPGLVLAGAWTATGYPDTMEGAVRSGERAADLLLAPRRTSAAVPAPLPESVR